MSRVFRILGVKGAKVSPILLTINSAEATEKFREIRAKKDLNFDYVEFSSGNSRMVKKVRMTQKQSKKKASKAE